VAVIGVGAATETELKEKKHRVEDALSATRAAVEEGIVPGGGVALINAMHALDNLKLDSDDANTGVQIVRRALQMPMRGIVSNAGLDGGVIQQQSSTIRMPKQHQHRLRCDTCEFVDMIQCRDHRPREGTTWRAGSATSIAGMMLTTEALITPCPRSRRPCRWWRRHGR